MGAAASAGSDGSGAAINAQQKQEIIDHLQAEFDKKMAEYGVAKSDPAMASKLLDMEKENEQLRKQLRTMRASSFHANDGSAAAGKADQLRAPVATAQEAEAAADKEDSPMVSFTAKPGVPGARSARLEDKYELGKTLGKGSFGLVTLAKDRKTGAAVAVKAVREICHF